MSQAVVERPQSRSRSWWVPGLVFAVVLGLIVGLTGLQAQQATAQATVTITVKVGGDRVEYKKPTPWDASSVINGDNGGIAGLAGVTVAARAGDSGSKTFKPSDLKTSPYKAISDDQGIARIQVPARAGGYYVGVIDTPDTHFSIEEMFLPNFEMNNLPTVGYTMHTGSASSNVTLPNFEGRGANGFSTSEYAMAWDMGHERTRDCALFICTPWVTAPTALSYERAQSQGSMIVPRKNPELPAQRCEAELNLVVMTDMSFSTKPVLPRNGGGEYRKGLLDLVDEVEGLPGGTLTLMTFAGESPAHNQPGPLTFDLQEESDVGDLRRQINRLDYVQTDDERQGTNWDAALWNIPIEETQTLEKADLALFVTDGMPTADAGMTRTQGDSHRGGSIGASKVRNLEMAVASANRLKANGIRVVAAGVGDGSGERAIPNLQVISGPREGRDYYRTGWSSLGQTLADSVTDSCTPDLKVTKTSDPVSGTLVEDGETITYTVTAENTGEVDLDVLLSDDLSRVLNNAEYNNDHYAGAQTDGLVFYGGTSDSDSHLDWAGRLNIGEQVEIVYSVMVDSAGQEVVLENSVTGTGNPTDGSPAITVGPISVNHHTEYSPTKPEIVPAPEYLIDKTSDPVSGTLVSENEEITYTITGVNDGNVDLNAELRDDLSEVLAHADMTSAPVASTGEVSFTGTDIYWTGPLAEGQAVAIVYTVTTHPGVGNVLINNVATGEATPIDPEHGTEPIIPAEVRTEHPTPDLLENPENPLPDTGGAGVWALVIGGLIVAVIGGAIWLIWRRRD